MFADKAERTLTLAVSQVVKLMWQKYTQVQPKCNPIWSHSLASEVANLKPVSIRDAAINQFYN